MSLTIISWCQKVHDMQVQVLPGPGYAYGDFTYLKSPWPCDPRTWTSGNQTQSGNVLTFKLTGERLCMPRWALWGYHDLSSSGLSPRFWIGPTIATTFEGQSQSATLTYLYGGAEIITVSGSSVYLGVVPDQNPGENFQDYAVRAGCPRDWISTFKSWRVITNYTIVGGIPVQNYITRASYAFWNGLPYDLLVRDPVYTGDVFGTPHLGPIYGFAYDGPIIPGDTQTVNMSIATDAVGDFTSGPGYLSPSNPSIPLNFYAIIPPDQ